MRTTPRLVASTIAEPTHWDSASLPLRAELGREAHRLIRSEHPDWESEITLRARVSLKSSRSLDLRGRADFIRSAGAVREVIEAKSVCLPPDLFAAETIPPALYSIQTVIYAYLLWRSEETTPSDLIAARLLCLNLADGTERSFSIDWSPASVEAILADYVTVVEEERRRLANRMRRRRRVSAELIWPYATIRPIQSELSDALTTAWGERDNILIEAPTGCGKTAAILFPALKQTLRTGRQLFYATAKSGGRNPVTLAASLLLKNTPELKAMILTSREEICSLAENAGLCDLCRGDDPEALDPPLSELETLFKGKLVTATEVIEWAQQREADESSRRLTVPVDFDAVDKRDAYFTRRPPSYSGNSHQQVCPYRISRLAVDLADLVIGDVNFIYDPAVTISQFRDVKPLRWALLLDEAHNLPERAREMTSAKISRQSITDRLERFQDDCWRYDDPAADEVLDDYTSLLILIGDILSEASDNAIVAVEPRTFEWANLAGDFGIAAGRLIARVGKRIDADVEADLWQTFGELKQLAARASLDPERNLHYPDPENGEVGIGCLDASEDMANQNRKFASLAGFSATLSPLTTTIRALGLSEKTTAFCQITPPAISDGRLLVLHAPGVETRLKRRPGSSGKVASHISRFARLSPGGVLAVFPSFDYIQLVAPLVEAKGVGIVTQTSGMSGIERAAFKRRLIERTGSLAAFVVAGGQFTEAEDFPDDQITGVVVVGPCLPPPDFWKEAIRSYHDERGDDGVMIAYLQPAMRKVVQAAGRMLRLESDRGIVLLADDRYLHEPLHPLLPLGWQGMIAHQSTDWETAAAEFWGAELPQSPETKRLPRRKRGR